MWLVRRTAAEPLGISTKPEAIGSIYSYNGDVRDAVRLVVQFPSLQFAEGIVDEARQRDGSIYKWERMPVGLIRFQGRRAVAQASDCQDQEVSVPIMAAKYPYKTSWYCTSWAPITSPKATHVMSFSFRKDKIGPFAVWERHQFVVRRANDRPVRKLIYASSTGGIWWHITEWLGDATGISSIADGHTTTNYHAETADYLVGVTGEELLITGRE